MQAIKAFVAALAFVPERFSLAVEAFLYRYELDGTNGGVATETESTGSDTRLLVRFFP